MSTNHEQEWFKALRLDERLPNDRALAQDRVDFERGQRRLERWRSEPQFANGPSFEQRLKSA